MCLHAGKRALTLTVLLYYGIFVVTLDATARFSENQEGDRLFYITDLTHLLSIRFYPMAKFNSVELKGTNRTVSMQPNGTGSLGLGFNYKSLGFGF